MSSSVTAQPVFTVFTPTFDRAHTLPRVYESLRQQTLQDFEWVVVDDGSTDGTAALVERWMEEAELPIRYFRQANSGKHVADNLAAREARGVFYATLDADDYYLPHSLETFSRVWETIDAGDRSGYVGVVALCADLDGAVIGTPFPRDPLDTTYTELADTYKVTGDKAGIAQTEVIRRFPFAVVPGEKLVIEGAVYAQIAQEYRIRCVNEVLKVVDYQQSGLSASARRDFQHNPRTASAYFLQRLQMPDPTSRSARVRAQAQHTRYALHAGRTLGSLKETPSTLLWLLTVPVALGLWLRDRLRP
jgi:glycosyltransferase involved in cell wall biosynthesis